MWKDSSLKSRRWGSTFCTCRRSIRSVARSARDLKIRLFRSLEIQGARGRSATRWRLPMPSTPNRIKEDDGGHKSIHPELGTYADFDHLVAATKAHGMEIALDIAFQCSPDHPWVTEHPSWFNIRPDGSIQYAENPPKKYQDIYPLNFESPDWRGLWDELYSVFEFWIKRGVYVFRVDNPHTKALPFWEWCLTTLRDQVSGNHISGRGVYPSARHVLARQGGVYAVVHVFHLAQHNGGVAELSRRDHAAAGQRFFPPELLAEHS